LAIAFATGCPSGPGEDATPSTTGPSSVTTDPATPAPAVEPARDFSAPGIAVVAHRGASAESPEHTFAAYDLAVEQGADYLEQDLQLTADGVLVVFHDPILQRTARGPADRCTGLVAERTLADLEACDVGSWFNEANPDRADETFTDERIPTMANVFDRYGSDVRYYIEIKSPEEQPGIEQALLELLDDTGIEPMDGDLPPIVIQSFSPESLRGLHGLRPELPLVQLISAVTGPPVDAASLDAIATYAVAIGPPSAFVDGDLVAAANERCLDVHPYTVDDPAEMADLLAAGVGAMFSNVPSTLREAVEGEPGPTLCPAPAAAG
jgi:glycerophosphoryl diester phosphodiesterase